MSDNIWVTHQSVE